MCLTIKEGETIRRAEKDILCYKSVWTNGSENTWTGIYFGFKEYEFDKEVTADERYMRNSLIKTDSLTHLESIGGHIYEGFHASCRPFSSSNRYCIIPEGTEMCYGNNGDVVAVSMIVFRNENSYKKYKIKKLWKRLTPFLSRWRNS